MSEVSKDVGGFCIMCAAIVIGSLAVVSLGVLLWTQFL